MAIDRVVTSASPIIVLYKSNLINVMEQLWDSVTVPDAVWEEVLAEGKDDVAARSLPDASWATRTVVTEIHPLVGAWDLGRGESEVLSFAPHNFGHRAMVDDKQARRCAQSLGIPTLGTGAALCLAKQRGLIPSLNEALDAIIGSGLWLSEQVVDILKHKGGE